jgi:hypothetical protein
LLQGLIGFALIAVVAVTSTQLIAAFGDPSGIMTVRVEGQQPITVDPRLGTARSPYVFGVTVFPADGTRSVDGAYGFMSYDASTVSGLAGASISMLRFPGGDWGEAHTPSYDQINAFLYLAQRTHATPMMQVRLAGSTPQQAAALVSYMNNANDSHRLQYPNAPFVPVHYWTIGNEPDLRGANYTVDRYVHDFIAFATAMRAVDPTIQIYGPEISQYNGPDAAPFDKNGVSWLDGFLKGIAAYEKHSGTHILSGVSFHRYPFAGSIDSSSLLFASAHEWQYALPLLRDQIRQDYGADLPVALTEVNTSPLGGATASPYATALWWADTLGALLEQHINAVDFFSARGLEHPYSLLTTDGAPTPLYRVMQLYSQMAPNVLTVGAASGSVRLYAATNASHDTLTLMLINESAQRAAITVDPQQTLSPWARASLTLPAYAIAVVVLHRDGSGQVALYHPSAQALAAGQAGAITRQPLH